MRSVLLWFAALGFTYAGLQHTLPPPELVSACIAAALGAVIAAALTSYSPERFAARWDWLLIFVRRLPVGILQESWLILGPMLWKAVFDRAHARGRFIALPFDPGGSDGRSASRRVAVIYGSSITPNSVPIFIDRERGLLVLHQLKARQEPGAGDREWPV